MYKRPCTLACAICALWVLPAFNAAAAGGSNVPFWSYDAEVTGQEYWGTLLPEYVECELGTQQSPISISETEITPMPPLVVNYASGKATAHNNGRGITIDVTGEQTLTWDGVVYHLKRLILHSPSEHTIRGKFHVMEIHFFHESADGKRLALAVFGDAGYDHNPALQSLLDHVPTQPARSSELTFNPGDLLASLSLKDYLTYPGSLTFPPCTEGIDWVILKNGFRFSKDQLKVVGKLVGRNARLPQPGYMRTIRETPE